MDIIETFDNAGSIAANSGSNVKAKSEPEESGNWIDI